MSFCTLFTDLSKNLWLTQFILTQRGQSFPKMLFRIITIILLYSLLMAFKLFEMCLPLTYSANHRLNFLQFLRKFHIIFLNPCINPFHIPTQPIARRLVSQLFFLLSRLNFHTLQNTIRLIDLIDPIHKFKIILFSLFLN